MSEYIPTTEEVRDVYQSRLIQTGTNIFALIDEEQADAEFDRWLAGVKAEAWEEGFDAGERDVHEHELTHWDDSDCIQNPYRGENK